MNDSKLQKSIEDVVRKAARSSPSVAKTINKICKGGPGSGQKGHATRSEQDLHEQMKQALHKKGISPEQYAKDKNNPTNKEIKSAHKYFMNQED